MSVCINAWLDMSCVCVTAQRNGVGSNSTDFSHHGTLCRYDDVCAGPIVKLMLAWCNTSDQLPRYQSITIRKQNISIQFDLHKWMDFSVLFSSVFHSLRFMTFNVLTFRGVVKNDYWARVSTEQWALTSEQWALSSDQWAVSSEHWPVSTDQWAVSTEQWAVSTDQWAVSTDQWALSNWPVSTD